MNELTDLEWANAEVHLQRCESAYEDIGTVGMFVRVLELQPQRYRFENGERTKELYDRIMAINL